eukprot:7381837-Pyramimonas_sp.AAC.1
MVTLSRSAARRGHGSATMLMTRRALLGLVAMAAMLALSSAAERSTAGKRTAGTARHLGYDGDHDHTLMGPPGYSQGMNGGYPQQTMQTMGQYGQQSPPTMGQYGQQPPPTMG